MNSKDSLVLRKMISYCEQIRQTHSFFRDDRGLFFNETEGFVYRNSVAMPILQIGELAKKAFRRVSCGKQSDPLAGDYGNA